jgi:hypothetical protein
MYCFGSIFKIFSLANAISHCLQLNFNVLMVRLKQRWRAKVRQEKLANIGNTSQYFSFYDSKNGNVRHLIELSELF